MSALNEIKAALRSHLGANYYHEEAPEDATYPYRVGFFGPSFDDDPAEVFALEIDYWDEGKSTARLDDLIDADAGDGDLINPTGLNRCRIAVTGGYAVFAYDTNVPVTDADKNYRHRRVSYTMRLYRED